MQDRHDCETDGCEHLTVKVMGQPSPHSVFTRRGEPKPGFYHMKAWQAQIQVAMKQVWNISPYEGPLMVETAFYMAPGKSAPTKDKEAYFRWCMKHVVMKPDLDNLRKAAIDALQGIVFVNDSQVISGGMAKFFIDRFEESEPYTLFHIMPVHIHLMDASTTYCSGEMHTAPFVKYAPNDGYMED